MSVIPRNPDLDRAIASGGGTPELALAYGDWLRDHEHPLAEAVSDAAAAPNDADAAQRMRLRVFAANVAEFEPFLFDWQGGVVAELGIQPLRYNQVPPLHERVRLLLQRDWMQLVGAVSVELPADPNLAAQLLMVLADLPPTVGTLSVFDPRMPHDAESMSHIDLLSVGLPHLQDLRLRARSVDGGTAVLLRGLRRLELGCESVALPPGAPLSHLDTLHLWTGMDVGAVCEVLGRCPHLKTLGLHHAGREPLDVASLVPDSLVTLILAAPDWAEPQLAECARLLRPGVAVIAPLSSAKKLPAGWSRVLPLDLPIFL